MKVILFINGKKKRLNEIKEVLEKNGLLGLRLILCEDIGSISSILHTHHINCIFYEINDSDFLKDLEYLRIIAHDIPKIVYGPKPGRKDLINIINYGSIFYFLEKPFKEYDLITALNNAISFNDEVLEKYKKVQKEYIKQQIEKLNNIGIALSSEHNLEKLLEQIISQALALAHCDAGSIYIKEGSMLAFMVAQNNTLKKRYGEGYEEKYFKRFHFPISKDRISGYVAATGETINIKDVYQIASDKEYRFTDDFDKRNNYVTKSMIVAPMKDPDNNILGVLQLINCLNEEGRIIPFDKTLENLIQSVASQAAVAIRNAQLINKVKEAHLDTKEAHFDTILRLSKAAEFRDDDTSEHLRRMTTYSIIIAKNLGLGEHDIELVKYAAPMHDIGKIGIPDSILFKPGDLTKSEWEEMKKHTIYGAQILGGSDSEILRASSIVAMNHHERWNGSGYPRGLKKDKIPIFGQIVSIADVFDALASKRCYKEAYDLQISIDEIKMSRSISFGPHIVEAFMKGLDEIIEVFNDSQKNILKQNQIIEESAIGA
jgi:response regulator RpfG family c-di-GMP phosphodiesterase